MAEAVRVAAVVPWDRCVDFATQGVRGRWHAAGQGA